MLTVSINVKGRLTFIVERISCSIALLCCHRRLGIHFIASSPTNHSPGGAPAALAQLPCPSPGPFGCLVTPTGLPTALLPALLLPLIR